MEAGRFGAFFEAIVNVCGDAVERDCVRAVVF
jgi:hypothetical protein